MATQSWSSRLRHDSDAVYQEWRDDFITHLNNLVAAGVLAADETNITPGAGARAGTNAEGHYAVYHLDDALHATAPVYIRFSFRTGASATAPQIGITVGTSTNGSGVLGGTALSTLRLILQGIGATSDTAYQSYMCGHDGFFGFVWKHTLASNEGNFWLCRTCDSSGTPDGLGLAVAWGQDNGNAATSQAFRFTSPAAAYTALNGSTNVWGYNPQNRTVSALPTGEIQTYVAWTPTPRAQPLFGVCGVLVTELAAGGTFSVALVGNTSRTFLTMGSRMGSFDAGGTLRHAMLYE